jgi:hypothetical protein
VVEASDRTANGLNATMGMGDICEPAAVIPAADISAVIIQLWSFLLCPAGRSGRDRSCRARRSYGGELADHLGGALGGRVGLGR